MQLWKCLTLLLHSLVLLVQLFRHLCNELAHRPTVVNTALLSPSSLWVEFFVVVVVVVVKPSGGSAQRCGGKSTALDGSGQALCGGALRYLCLALASEPEVPFQQAGRCCVSRRWLSYHHSVKLNSVTDQRVKTFWGMSVPIP